MPRTTDKSFGSAVHEKNSQNKSLSSPQSHRGRKSTARSFAPDEAFVVKHFAGDVTYCVDNFLDKNMDPLDLGLVDMIAGSGVPLVRQLFTTDAEEAAAAATGGRKKKKQTVGGRFMTQLAALAETLNATTSHFVRCLKPNNEKQPGRIDKPKLIDQLRCSGMMDALKLMHDGYPSRCPFDDLRQRYSNVLPTELSDLPAAQVRQL